jgi:hypothetical protein
LADAQQGTHTSFDFVQLSPHARQAGLGGYVISIPYREVSFVFANPSLVSDSLASQASASYMFYVGDIGQSTVVYAHPFSVGTLAAGVRHINYGTVEGYDATGAPLGEFTSGETEVLVGGSRQVGAFRLGVSLKGLFSNIAGYRAAALCTDLGGVFIHPEKQLTFALTFKNLGVMLKEYSETSSTTLPFDVQVGATLKPEHMPFRFSATVFNLTGLGNAYNDPSMPDDDPSALDEIMQHINLGAEILVTKSVHALVGYNGLRQQELQVEQGGGGSGFTFGFSVQRQAFELAVSRARYAASQASYLLTLNVNTRKLIRKNN